MNIRPETVSDYAAIGDVHAHAFGDRAAEALIVALLRQRRAYDPDLSLVAELDGRVVGHVLFSPHRLRLLDQTVPAVNLAPLGVAPAQQKQGIGSSLIAEGHRVAAAKGYTVSFVLGHPRYYPRFGYRPHAYGAAQATVQVAAPGGEELGARAAVAGDAAALQELWRRDEAAVDFALEPGTDLLDWLSPNSAVRALVFVRDGEVAGYARIHAAEPARPRVFLARDGAVALAMARLIAREAGAGTLDLPIHPAAAAAQGFVRPACTTWEAAMARELAPSPLDDYFARVREGRRFPGRVTWPVAFD